MSYKQVYDLVFRARSARLNSVAYVLDFYDWVKAGVAFNTRGFEVSTRKISYFVKLYSLLQESRVEGIEVLKGARGVFEQALQFYYEDIFDIFQDHLRSKHGEAGQRYADSKQRRTRSVPDFGELLILPCFDNVPELSSVFEKRIFPWNAYECVDKEKFLERANSAYLQEGTGLFRCMSLVYDYGVLGKEQGVLLEVSLWDSEM